MGCHNIVVKYCGRCLLQILSTQPSPTSLLPLWPLMAKRHTNNKPPLSKNTWKPTPHTSNPGHSTGSCQAPLANTPHPVCRTKLVPRVRLPQGWEQNCGAAHTLTQHGASTKKTAVRSQHSATHAAGAHGHTCLAVAEYKQCIPANAAGSSSSTPTH